MAWVNRTTRDQAGAGSFVASTGASHLGPGAYESSPTRRVKPNAAAFGSSSEPERGAVGSGDPGTIGQSFVTPGPGAYANANQCSWESPTKTSVFQSKTQREMGARQSNQTPGPGAYVKQDSFGKRSKKKQSPISLNTITAKDPPKSTKIKWARLPSAPSIPTHSQSFGYEQGPYGKLVRHEPANVGHSGRPEDTIGPGDYDPLRGLHSIHKSRATDFSKSRVSRSLEQEIKQRAELPGPGQYIDPSPSAAKDAQRASAIFKAAARDKAAALGQSDAAKHPVPGPGSYFEGYKGFTTTSKPEHLQFFGSTSTRFDSSAARDPSLLSPGPGSYYAPPPSFSSPAPRRKGSSAPFSCKKERFDHAQPKEEYLAAPGSYNVPTAMGETLNKVTSRVQTFGTTTKRFDSLSSHEVDSHVESQLEREMRAAQPQDKGGSTSANRTSQKAKPSSVFVSSSTRFKPLEKAVAPSPGDYEIQASWNAPGASGTFKSATDRMKQKTSATGDVPGPGSYSVPAAVVHKPLHMARPDVFVGAEPRFKKTLPKVQVPGPGAYSTQTIENDWNRPTYNITIATEMELAMIR